MERVNGETGTIPMNIYANDFGVIDFLNETNFDQFMELIRGENEADAIVDFSSTHGYGVHDHQQNDLRTGSCLSGGQIFPLAPAIELLDIDMVTSHLSNVNTNYTLLDGILKDGEEENMENEEEEDEEEEEEEEESSATTTTSTPTNKKCSKRDRSRTLVSERKRRSRMKDKLYALRSLVPIITKMNKASIVGDAVLYVQDLQKQAKKLKNDIANLESSLKAGDNQNRKTMQSSKKMNATSLYPIIKKIHKMDIYQLEERAFYVRVVSNNEKGVVTFLYKALESLTSFNVRSSNVVASTENYVFTFTLNILESEIDMSLPNLKLWIASVFLDQGFDFETLLSS